ncbi:MAG TPA: ERAP1-like C-terminal domain-containing protein, partial [Tahibacter sp.]|nr:ERAP1-like C-terminal domain-containing protein [Tahibacter sp.]
SAALTGGLMLGVRLPAEALAAQGSSVPEVTHWIQIYPDETVVVKIARSELGQGTFTGLAQLVAEELECDWSKVRAEYADVNEHVRRNRIWGAMSTGGSRGIRDSQLYVRKGGAAAREMLLTAAAQRWGVPVCVRAGYGAKSTVQCELLDAASGTMALADGCPDWYLPNADARGYYRIAMPAAELGRLTAAVEKLSEREQLGFADAIRAGFERGDVDAAAVLAAMRQLAPSKTREISTALFVTFVWIRDRLADDATRPALDAFAASLYLPRLRELGYAQRSGESSDDALMRAALAEFLARDVDNAEVRAAMLEQGRAVLKPSADGHLMFRAANYDLLGTVLAVTVEELGAPAIDALVAEIGRQSDPTLRASMIGALGATRDGKLGDRVRGYALTDAVKLGEVMRLLSVNQAQPENRAAFWTWLKANFDAVVKRMPAKGEGRLVERASDGWCDAAQEKELVEFFTPRLATLTGGDTALARARERIVLCAARCETHGTASLAAWAKANPPPAAL